MADRATARLTEFYEDGIRATPEDWAALAEIVGELLAGGASWLAMAGSIPAAEDLPGSGVIFAGAGGAGVRCALDSRGPDLVRALESGPDLVKINAYEASELLGRPVTEIAQARDAADEVRERAGGAGHAAIVTLGEAGMVLADPAGGTWHGTVAAHGDYPVGSGDARSSRACSPRWRPTRAPPGRRRRGWVSARRRPTPRSRGPLGWIGLAPGSWRPRQSSAASERGSRSRCSHA